MKIQKPQSWNSQSSGLYWPRSSAEPAHRDSWPRSSRPWGPSRPARPSSPARGWAAIARNRSPLAPAILLSRRTRTKSTPPPRTRTRTRSSITATAIRISIVISLRRIVVMWGCRTCPRSLCRTRGAMMPMSMGTELSIVGWMERATEGPPSWGHRKDSGGCWPYRDWDRVAAQSRSERSESEWPVAGTDGPRIIEPQYSPRPEAGGAATAAAYRSGTYPSAPPARRHIPSTWGVAASQFRCKPPCYSTSNPF